MTHEVLKHPHEHGRRGKVYVGEALEHAINEYNANQPCEQNHISPLPCSGRAYSYRLMKVVGSELEASDVLHRFYGKYTFEEIENLMSRRKHELQTELRRITQELANQFDHINATKSLWAAHEAIKTKLVNKKSATLRRRRAREDGKASKNDASTECNAEAEEKVSKHRERVTRMVEARKSKAAQRRSQHEAKRNSKGTHDDEEVSSYAQQGHGNDNDEQIDCGARKNTARTSASAPRKKTEALCDEHNCNVSRKRPTALSSVGDSFDSAVSLHDIGTNEAASNEIDSSSEDEHVIVNERKSSTASKETIQKSSKCRSLKREISHHNPNETIDSDDEGVLDNVKVKAQRRGVSKRGLKRKIDEKTVLHSSDRDPERRRKKSKWASLPTLLNRSALENRDRNR